MVMWRHVGFSVYHPSRLNLTFGACPHDSFPKLHAFLTDDLCSVQQSLLIFLCLGLLSNRDIAACITLQDLCSQAICDVGGCLPL